MRLTALVLGIPRLAQSRFSFAVMLSKVFHAKHSPHLRRSGQMD